ncbi:NADH dehydrogenase [ubiquinone] 1 beta subcomplex subunit 1 [Plecturocebus cupreus]
MAQSRLTATSASRVQAIFLPQLPDVLFCYPAIMVNFHQIVRNQWVHIFVPMGFVLGCYLDRKNDEKLTAFRNKSALQRGSPRISPPSSNRCYLPVSHTIHCTSNFPLKGQNTYAGNKPPEFESWQVEEEEKDKQLFEHSRKYK